MRRTPMNHFSPSIRGQPSSSVPVSRAVLLDSGANSCADCEMDVLPWLSTAFRRVALAALAGMAVAQPVFGQSIQFPWSGFAHTPQHDCISSVPSQPLNRVKWTTPVFRGTASPYSHFSPPVITRSNTVLFPTASTNGGLSFTINALAGGSGQTNWQQPTDYLVQGGGHYICPLALTPKNRLYFAGAGGTVFYCDSPDASASPTFTRTSFYGLTNYSTNTNAFNSSVYISTPITPDRYGNIFFGFDTVGTSPLGAQGGLARIDFNGTGSWISASNAAGVATITQSLIRSAPAVSLNEKTIYMAFINGAESAPCYLAALDSRTLVPLASVRLLDPETGSDPDESISTASPTIAPDGDVYFGILGDSTSENGDGGWLLHFDSSLSVSKIPGPFGWDVTDSVVSASLVPSYGGSSTYLLATKYNNYDTKQYNMALFDPQQGVSNSVTKVTAMAAVLTVPSPTGLEWCVNSAAVDPFTKSVLANNEDGYLYRWDLTSNQLIESIALTTTQTGEAYTPTVVGVDGAVYAINHGYLFAVGQ
jgi:hypothetical protein